MNIFGNPNTLKEQKVTNIQQQKNRLFRVQIRRSHMQKMFKTSRNEHIKLLKSLKFLEQVKNQKDNYNTPRKIQQLLEGLQKGRNHGFFYQNINEMGLQVIILDHLTNQSLAICQKSQFLRILIEQTYYCSRSLGIVIKQNEAVQHIMASIKQMSVEQQQNIQYIENVVALLLNLSGHFDADFNNFLIDYDFLIPLMNKIESISRFNVRRSFWLRDYILRLHLNLINKKTQYNRGFCIKQITIIISDSNFSKFNLSLVFNCLKNMCKIYNLFQQACKENPQFIRYLQQAIQFIPQSNDQQYQCFLDFLITLLDNQQQTVGRQVFLFVNLNEFIQRMLKFDKNNSYKKFIKCCIVFLKTALQDNILSQIFIQRNDIQKYIQALMNYQYFKHGYYGYSCIKVLIKLLEQDGQLLEIMINNGLFDYIPQLIEYRQCKNTTIYMIDLIEAVIQSWNKNKDRNKKNQQVIQMFYGKGFILPIQDLQNRDQEDISNRAQNFMNWISQLSHKK